MCILDSIYYESDGAVRTDLLILRTTDEQIASRDVWHAIQFTEPFGADNVAVIVQVVTSQNDYTVARVRNADRYGFELQFISHEGYDTEFFTEMVGKLYDVFFSGRIIRCSHLRFTRFVYFQKFCTSLMLETVTAVHPSMCVLQNFW